jgi:hypothetical protein
MYLWWSLDMLTLDGIPLGNTVNRAKIPKEGEKTTHEVLVRKLHEGIGPELDVKNKAMYITDFLGGHFE